MLQPSQTVSGNLLSQMRDTYREQIIMAGKKKTVDLTTGIGTFSFPRVFASTKGKKDDGSDSYDIQFLIPKNQREDCRAILEAIKEVAVDAYGDPGWKRVSLPLRDGDREADNVGSDGVSNREKYPERLGHYFLNARSSKPVAVVDRQRNVIDNPDDLYGGSKGKIAVTFYAYNNNSVGVGVSLNGVQKLAEGESLGNVKPSIESMFDMLDDEDDLGLDTETETEAPPAKKAPAKKADDEDDLMPDDGDDDESIYDDL